MSDPLSNIQDLASRAVEFDRNGNITAAAYYYEECGRRIAEADNAEWRAKGAEYLSRAAQLRSLLDKKEEEKVKDKNAGKGDLEMAFFLLSEGLDEDEKGHSDEAMQCYQEAVELCIKAKKQTEDADLKAKLTKVATQALERAENIKGIDKKPLPRKVDPPTLEGINLGDAPSPPMDDPGGDEEISQGEMVKFDQPPPLPSTSGGFLTEEEKRVLAATSFINGREYVPFLSVDLKEKFAFSVPYTDRHGKLPLSKKQTDKLSKWCRPEEFMPDPKVLLLVDCFSVKQTVVSDCSFVASIAISAQYEKRFGKKLITRIIYPQNRKGEPVYNPCGKYMVKLMINGVPRKVIIDDYFPLGRHGEPLCSYSSNRNELWISLLEKAYMKVMGGYDFPGSNSNIDLYALTGWIPERVSIKPMGDQAFDKDAVFRKLLTRFHKGHVLVTLATGEMSDAEADRAGLVPTHAYAMLDIKEVKGLRLFLLKNPWAHLRWKGNYSEMDTRHWTPELMKALKYDPKNAQNFDNGVFWIDYDSLCQFFDVIYMNWSPDLFPHKSVFHQCWRAGLGPTKDLYDISNNPQFSLDIKGRGEGALWILLSRHITDIEDFKNNKEYITVLVYKNDGKKVYYPFDPPPYIDGIRINSPHYLCQTVIKESTPRRLTLVISQYEKSATIYFTLRVYSTLPFSLRKIGDPYKHKQEAKGEWKGKSAGGCANYRDTFPNNPRFQFKIEVDSHVLVEVKAPKQFQIGFDLICVVAGNKDSPVYFSRKNSGPYRSGFVILALEMVAGTYDIVPTTFKPGQEGPFFLKVQASSSFKLNRMQ